MGGWKETSPLPPSKGEMRRASRHEQYDVGTGERLGKARKAERTGTGETSGASGTSGSASRTGDYGTSGTSETGGTGGSASRTGICGTGETGGTSDY